MNKHNASGYIQSLADCRVEEARLNTLPEEVLEEIGLGVEDKIEEIISISFERGKVACARELADWLGQHLDRLPNNVFDELKNLSAKWAGL